MQLHFPHHTNFIELIDCATESGDIYCIINNYDANNLPTLDKVSSLMESIGYGLFCFGNNIAHLQNKFDAEIRNDGDKYIYLFRLAPMLGLPSNNDVEELKELKDFLLFIKEKSFQHPTEELALFLMRYNNEQNMDEVKLSVLANDEKLSEQLTLEMDDVIRKSPVLSQWLDNQKIGINNTHLQCNNLFANFPAYRLMTHKEQDQQIATIKEYERAQKKDTLGKKKKY